MSGTPCIVDPSEALDSTRVIVLDDRRAANSKSAAGPATVLLLGWGGAKLEQLRSYEAWYRAEGFEVLSYVLPLSTLRSGALVLADVRELLGRLRRSEAPLIVHSFSNNGFVLYATLLSLDTNGELRKRVVAHVFDSGPGLAAEMTAASYAEDLSRGLLAAVSSTRRGKRRWLAGLVGVCAQLVLRLHYHLVPEIAGHYGAALDRYAALAPAVPVLSLTAERDAVVSSERIQTFFEAERTRTAATTLVVFSGSKHVRHFRRHREAYVAAVRGFLSAALGQPGEAPVQRDWTKAC